MEIVRNQSVRVGVIEGEQGAEIKRKKLSWEMENSVPKGNLVKAHTSVEWRLPGSACSP